MLFLVSVVLVLESFSGCGPPTCGIDRDCALVRGVAECGSPGHAALLAARELGVCAVGPPPGCTEGDLVANGRVWSALQEDMHKAPAAAVIFGSAAMVFLTWLPFLSFV